MEIFHFLIEAATWDNGVPHDGLHAKMPRSGKRSGWPQLRRCWYHQQFGCINPAQRSSKQMLGAINMQTGPQLNSASSPSTGRLTEGLALCLDTTDAASYLLPHAFIACWRLETLDMELKQCAVQLHLHMYCIAAHPLHADWATAADSSRGIRQASMADYMKMSITVSF